MGLPPFEKELLHDEYWSLWQSTKLPSDVEEDTLKRDIWNYDNQIERPKLSLKMLIKKLFFKLGYFNRQKAKGSFTRQFKPHLKQF